MPMSTDQLKEILEAEIKRIGVHGVRVMLPTRVVFRSERGVLLEDMTPGQALDFLAAVADGSVETFAQLGDQQSDYLNEEEDAEEDDDDEDEPDEPGDDEDESDDEEPEEPGDDEES